MDRGFLRVLIALGASVCWAFTLRRATVTRRSVERRESGSLAERWLRSGTGWQRGLVMFAFPFGMIVLTVLIHHWTDSRSRSVPVASGSILLILVATTASIVSQG